MNLVLSIVGIQYIGLAGVYVGTVVSGLMANLIQPVIIYRDCFGRRAWSYFGASAKYIGVIAAVAAVMTLVKQPVMGEVNLMSFVVMVAIITVVYNMAFVLCFRKTEEFTYLWALVKRKIPRQR